MAPRSNSGAMRDVVVIGAGHNGLVAAARGAPRRWDFKRAIDRFGAPL